ncbi:MAG: galactose oxidase [Verrucomicrobiota bacterium]
MNLALMAQVAGDSPSFLWKQLPPIPDREGFAGAFAGVSQGSLLVAGGANFPGKKPWEGGKKIWYDGIFALATPTGEWKKVGKLPRPLGYGVSVTTAEGMVCVGGSDLERHYADAFMVTLSGSSVKIRLLPSLPVPMANGAGAVVGSVLYVFGGSDVPGEVSVFNRLFALDLSAPAAWKELEPCPGKARLLPVAASLAGTCYVAGGATLQNSTNKMTRVYLTDAWCYQPAKGWKRLADLPRPCVAGPSPAPVCGNRFYLVGGDDGSHVGFTPPDKHPGFARDILVYDTITDAWQVAGPVPAPRAVLPVAFWQNQFVMPNGEIRPGVRSPEVWSLKLGAEP